MNVTLPRPHVEALSRWAGDAHVAMSVLIRDAIRDGLARRSGHLAALAPACTSVPDDPVVHRLALGMHLERDLRRFAAQLPAEVTPAAVIRAAVTIHLTTVKA